MYTHRAMGNKQLQTQVGINTTRYKNLAPSPVTDLLATGDWEKYCVGSTSNVRHASSNIISFTIPHRQTILPFSRKRNVSFDADIMSRNTN